MPRIQDEVLRTAIYLYRNKVDAQTNAAAGGSGFLVGYVEEDGNTINHVYAVTNAHVIRGGYTVIRLNTVSGTHDILELPQNAWVEHPDGDDIAVCCTSLSPTHDFKFVLSDAFVTEDKLHRYNIGIGDEVFMVGRLIGHAGTKKNLPIARFGSVSSLPLEDLKNFCGKYRPHFLVEVRSVSGFSGSPVFVYDAPVPPSLVDVRKERFSNMLLGIDSGHMPTSDNQMSAGIAGIVPAWKLLELLNRPEFKEQRKRDEETLKEKKEKQSTVVPDTPNLK